MIKKPLLMEAAELREMILAEHSRAQCARIVKWVGNSPKRFGLLFQFLLNDPEQKVKQRAGWPLSYCVEANPAFIRGKMLQELLKNLDKPLLHDAVRRNTFRILNLIKVPQKYEGCVMDRCFEIVSSPSEKAAVKSFALSILNTLATIYPEILPELKLVIEEQLPHETAAFKSQARKILTKAKKL